MSRDRSYLHPIGDPITPARRRMLAAQRRYPSEVDAKQVARKCEAKRGTPLRAYLCWPGCGGWHLTRRLEVPDHVRAREGR